MHSAEISYDGVQAGKVCKLDLDLVQSAVDEQGNQICELVGVEHFWHFDVCLCESRQGLPAFLDVANFKEQRQFLTLTHVIRADLGVETSQKILSFGELEFDGIPIVYIQKLLQLRKGVEEDASGVHASVPALVDGLVAERDQ